MQSLLVSVPARAGNYEVAIGRGLLSTAGKRIRRRLGPQTQRLAVISNKKVFKLYGAQVVHSLEASGFRVLSWLMGDGEHYKSLDTARAAIQFLSESGLQRSDAVVSLGGGVTGDLAGFAAAIYLRGVPFVQIPTTLVAQSDASIGGKVGVNFPDGKNRSGVFHQPVAVISDVNTLLTLPGRELTAGWCECVKQGAIASRKLFKQTTNYLSQIANKRIVYSAEFDNLIAAHCAFKAAIVKADEREDPSRLDRRSRRVLNFGHTVGHAIEQLTGYRRFRHGEAVGHGMLVAGELSKNLGLLDQSELELLRTGVNLCGPLPAADDIEVSAIIGAMAHDKKSSHGQMQWVLLERIGRPRIVRGEEISAKDLKAAIRAGLRK